jgi:hypothetical protein
MPRRGGGGWWWVVRCQPLLEHDRCVPTNVRVRGWWWWWWVAQPIAEAAQCEEQARVEEELMPQLLRAAGLPDELCDPARLAAHNPFALSRS